MTDKQAIEVLKSWLNLAYHNADGTNESSAELYEALHTMFKLINRQKATIERLEDMVRQDEGVLPKYENYIKSEAIKEFAERLKDNAEETLEYSSHYFTISEDDIDDLVKEMTEENP